MNHGVADKSQKPEFPTVYSPHPRANIAREWGTHSLEVRDKIHNGKEDGPPSPIGFQIGAVILLFPELHRAPLIAGLSICCAGATLLICGFLVWSIFARPFR